MPEDRKTAHAVEKALADSEETAGLEHLHISGIAGVIFLDGELESVELRAKVIEVAKSVQGVRMVRDRTQINPNARGGGWKQPHTHEGGG